MSVDEKTVRRIADLARIAVPEDEVAKLADELNAILGFVEQLSEVETEGVQPMTSVVERDIKRREDVVSDGGYAANIVANAPVQDDNYFAVPKVVE
ncbi:MAG: Asp-tRNA(Asn)/Glu-tRNA(Gln) amidotransferase subunit GatC [Parvibaculales bacterium]